jgi:mRNA-degrading endonuclease YafQ of YafQ-DinJ toxin-antitoxin module
MKKRYHHPIKNAARTAIVLIVTAAAATLAMADQNPLDPKYMEGREGVVRQLPRKTVTIEEKMLEAVITNIGDRFQLSKETIITGLDGKQVSIRQMLVPCDAEIIYETKQGARIAQRIKMLRVESNSRWQWSSDLPE